MYGKDLKAIINAMSDDAIVFVDSYEAGEIYPARELDIKAIIVEGDLGKKGRDIDYLYRLKMNGITPDTTTHAIIIRTA